jgi:hypothetical protein
MSYGRRYQNGPNGELFRARVTIMRRQWNPSARSYSDTEVPEETIYGPYTTRGAAASAAGQMAWPRDRVVSTVIEKLTTAVWTPVEAGGGVAITPERYAELLAAEALLKAVMGEGE